MKALSIRLRRWLWFFGIYLVSVAVFALVAGLLHVFFRTQSG